MRIAVDLLWVKHKAIGGVESYVRNLLDGLLEQNEEIQLVLLTTLDNHESFSHYGKHKNVAIIQCPVYAQHLFKTVLWENFKLDKFVSKLNVDFCFVPYYRKPITKCKNDYLIVLHDLQALHFPEYFSKAKYLWLKYYWKYCLESATHIVAISQFVRTDIIQQYLIPADKISVIYNPVKGDDVFCDFKELKEKYQIEEKSFYYTISSLLKHKNLMTILKVMKEIKEKGLPLCRKLLISGISGKDAQPLQDYIIENGLQENCIYTGFVSDRERNTLVKNARLFLFPSVFEGFGMPPIEALKLGTNVVTTQMASIPEVTKGNAVYVADPFNVNEWIQTMLSVQNVSIAPHDFSEYNIDVIAKDYFNVFKRFYK